MLTATSLGALPLTSLQQVARQGVGLSHAVSLLLVQLAHEYIQLV